MAYPSFRPIPRLRSPTPNQPVSWDSSEVLVPWNWAFLGRISDRRDVMIHDDPWQVQNKLQIVIYLGRNVGEIYLHTPHIYLHLSYIPKNGGSIMCQDAKRAMGFSCLDYLDSPMFSEKSWDISHVPRAFPEDNFTYINAEGAMNPHETKLGRIGNLMQFADSLVVIWPSPNLTIQSNFGPWNSMEHTSVHLWNCWGETLHSLR